MSKTVEVIRTILPLFDEPPVDYARLAEEERLKVSKAEAEVLTRVDGVGKRVIRMINGEHSKLGIGSRESASVRYQNWLKGFLGDKTHTWREVSSQHDFARFTGAIHAQRFTQLQKDIRYKDIVSDLGAAAAMALDTAAGFGDHSRNWEIEPVWLASIRMRAKIGRIDTADLGKFIYNPPRVRKKL